MSKTLVVVLVCTICLTQAKLIIKDELWDKAFRDLKNINVQDKLAELLFATRREAFDSVNLLLHTRHNAKVEEILDSFNRGLKHKLLIINDKYIEINTKVLKQVFTKNVKKLHKIFDNFEDGLLQNTLEEFMKTIDLETVESRILVSEFALARPQTNFGLHRSYCQDVANDAQAILVDFWQECYNIITDPSKFEVTDRYSFFVRIIKVALKTIIESGKIIVQNISCSSRKRRAVSEDLNAPIVSKLFSKAVSVFWKVAISSFFKMFGSKYVWIIGGFLVVILLAFSKL